MAQRDTFSSYHPLINFLYFGIVLVFSMILMHPVALLISMAGAFSYVVNLNGRRGLLFGLKVVLPMMIGAALINPAFSHGGIHILCYLPSGNPLTLESILYGLAAAAMLAGVLMWFRCYTEVMTSDKFVYLFGRIIPALSLVLSMTLRFVPKFKTRFDVAREAAESMGQSLSEGSLWSRTKNGIKVFSILITWSLENAIETADSMKSRGYGLKGRSAFSIYRFDSRDMNMLLWVSFCGLYLLCGTLAKGLFFRYYPSLKGVLTEPFTVSFYLVYLAFCMTPVFVNEREERKWRSLKSEI